ncbi:MAG: hypothetical protein RIS28_351, partial [Bacteroidota bacterium]
IIATHTLVWKFNPQYLLGINIINLPIEEYMFFIVVPYACLFIYACLKSYWPKWHSHNLNKITSFGIILLSAICIIKNPSHAYTSSTFCLLSVTYCMSTLSYLLHIIIYQIQPPPNASYHFMGHRTATHGICEWHTHRKPCIDL